MKLIGPFTQILTLKGLPLRGKLNDEQLEIINEGGIVVDDEGLIFEIDSYQTLSKNFENAERELIEEATVALPAFVDAHTHICFGGNRANDFAMRNSGKTYLEIAEIGGGIWSTVTHTRAASENELLSLMLERVNALLEQGVTTIEVKSGYGLNAQEELKMLRVIKEAQKHTKATLVPTCLAAHTLPKDLGLSHDAYLDYIVNEILPVVKEEALAKRVDIFIEKSAFNLEDSKVFLNKAKEMGFNLTVHADQFTPGSSRVAVEVGAKSADHLEATADEDIEYLAQSNTVAIALPGASIGLGDSFTPARRLLDAGAIFAIATDWNPGSAPMGQLLPQASILATFQKLSNAEVLSAITFRAAYALDFEDRGQLVKGKRADIVCYPTQNYQNITYLQGALKASRVFIKGESII